MDGNSGVGEEEKIDVGKGFYFRRQKQTGARLSESNWKQVSETE